MPFRRIKYAVRLMSSSTYFTVRFVRYSGIFFIGQKRIQGHILAVIHGIEKGINMPDRRNLFGVTSVEYLITLSEKYSNYLKSEPDLKIYIANTLVNWLVVVDVELVSEDIISKISSLAEDIGGARETSQKGLTPEIVASWRACDYSSFASSRRSVRCFEEIKLSEDIVSEVVRAAHNSASVCNRDLPDFFVINSDLIKNVLEIQGGASGFIHRVFNLGIIGYKVNRLYDPEEYRQGFFDAGLFAQCLSFEMQSRGYGSVFLNWAQTPAIDRELRRIVELPASFEVCCLIAYGVPDVHNTSPRSLRI